MVDRRTRSRLYRKNKRYMRKMDTCYDGIIFNTYSYNLLNDMIKTKVNDTVPPYNSEKIIYDRWSIYDIEKDRLFHLSLSMPYINDGSDINKVNMCQQFSEIKIVDWSKNYKHVLIPFKSEITYIELFKLIFTNKLTQNKKYLYLTDMEN